MKAVLALVLVAAVVVQAQVQVGTPADRKAHNTDIFRDANGKPSTLNILRRNEAFTVTAAAITPASTFSIELGRETAPLTVVKAGTGSAQVKHTQGAIGRFNLVITTGGSKVSAPIILIANPWEAADETFVPSTSSDLFPSEIAEHVLNERGALWQGSTKSNAWIPWAFNQFDDSVVSTTVDLLQGMSLKQRASTALVVRFLTSQTSNVLQGRWDGEYSDGQKPGFWSSSTQIVSQYQKTKRVVKYGQCWVFAGLLTALCRSAGIPSRPLTNFDSAHEEQPFDQVCNTYYTKKSDGSYSKTNADNSVWNFHVWVDAWMKRPDLQGADGWQAIDATPQEESSGPAEAPFANKDYRCGPAPHSSIRAMKVKGVGSDFDVAFVAGEANCLKVDWVDGKKYSTIANQIGETIITKSPDSKCNGETSDTRGYTSICKSNLARSYSKADTPTGSGFLQIAHRLGLKQTSVAPTTYTVKIAGTTDAGKDEEHVRLGKKFSITVTPASAGAGAATYSATLSAVSYNGAKMLKSAKIKAGDKTATPAVLAQVVASKPISLVVEHADWGKAAWKETVPKQTLTLELLVVVTPKSANAQPFLYRKLIYVVPPKLAMLCGSKNRKPGPVACNVQAWNPLPYALSNPQISFTVSGAASAKEQSSSANQVVSKAFPANSQTSFTGRFDMRGAAGKQQIIAKFSSEELDGIVGTMDITIQAEGQQQQQQQQIPLGNH